MVEDIHWNSRGQPVSNVFNDVYFSQDNGLEESRYVFLQHNQLSKRFAALDNNSRFIIGETGFGTGLNFLATYCLWQQTAPKDAQLHYIAVEKFPLAKQTLQRALALWPELDKYSQQLLRHYPATTRGFHRCHLPHNSRVTLIIDDAQLGLEQLLISSHADFQRPQWNGIDAWFLDGFAPAKNPDMWSKDLFAIIAKLSKPGTSLATFTAAGLVRRGLTSVGFSISKTTGYGRKREMCIGVYTPQSSPQHRPVEAATAQGQRDNAAWMAINNYQATPNKASIAIIGGGMAGCHSAYALARKGVQVHLFEQADTLAAGASGNEQAIVYGKLSPNTASLGEFNLYCCLYAQQFYANYWEQHDSSYGAQCGVLQLAFNEQLQQAHKKIVQRLHSHLTDIGLSQLSAREASQVAGTRIDYPGLFFPRLGWINPKKLCQWLSTQPNIKVVTGTAVSRLERQHQHWQVHTKRCDQQQQRAFDTVIIANAYAAHQFEQSAALPINKVRGQVTYYPGNALSAQLATAICGKGYIAPATHTHCIGATFTPGSLDTAINGKDHQHNLQQLAQHTPELIDQTIASSQLDGRVSFRCTTPDYLPMVGAVPIAAAVAQQYQPLKYNARQIINQAAHCHPNLYINIGHGSRGLAYTPLCSEFLASLIVGDAPPIPQALARTLNPTRFLIRQLIRS